MENKIYIIFYWFISSKYFKIFVTFVYFVSGAGKTSLINVLTFRNIRSLAVSGDIKINDRVVNRDQMNDVSAYLQQEDLFLGTMTVREHLLFKVQCSLSLQKINITIMNKRSFILLCLCFLRVSFSNIIFFSRHEKVKSYQNAKVLISITIHNLQNSVETFQDKMLKLFHTCL